MRLYLKVITLWFLTYSSLFAYTIESKLEMLAQLQKPYKSIVIDYDPFFGKESKSGNEIATASLIKEELRLLSIMNNQAFIRGRWYRVGDKIDDGKITNISINSVQIRFTTYTEILTFDKSKKILHVKDRCK